MDNRDRILDAAARVYAELGFRGATTRRIAEAAGVNEVTLFRTFGSKEALIGEALRCRAQAGVVLPHALPERPVDPERELTAWAETHLIGLRGARALIRKSLAEMEAHPEIGPCVAEGWNHAGNELRRYMVALEEHGFVDWATFGAEDEPPCPPHCDGGDASDAVPGAAGPPRNEHAFAAGAMLMAALFSDAMGRDVMPELHPQPAERAPALYVRLFLRVVGCAPPCASPERATRGRPADGAAGAKAPARTAAPGRGGRRRAS